MSTKKPKADRERFNMRIPRPLLKWARAYAAEKNLSVTQILVNHLTSLKEQNDIP